MHNFKTLKTIIGRLEYILNLKQKRGAVIVLFAMIISSLFELIGVSAIYPFLDTMMSPSIDSDKWYVSILRFYNPKMDTKEMLLILSILIIIVYLVKNVVVLICSYIMNSYSAIFKRELSVLMLKSYLRRPYEFFVNTNTAEVQRGINSDTTATYETMSDLFQFSTDSLTVLLIGAYLIKTDWLVACGALILAMTCFVAIVFGFKKKMKSIGRAYIDASTKQYKYSIQAVNGTKEIYVMDRRDCFIDEYERSAIAFEKIMIAKNFISACPDRLLEGICVGGFVGIACMRLMRGAEAQYFIPVLGSFAMGAFKILPSISRMSNRINNIIYNQHGLANCFENIKEARNIDEQMLLESLENQSDIEEINEKESLFSDSIKINKITWKYRNSSECVIRDLSLTIKKGESIALIGASGAGKTTLADIILGLYKPQKGSVLMDETDIFKIPHLWAKIVGYVPQSVYLTDDSIKSNIAFGLPRELIDENKVWKALEQAQLADFIMRLPEGLNTIVGERGIKFSGGQRQRVAIARALYDDPEILVLDEATSALDNETETAVMEAISSLLGKKTIIIIAHRLSTIRDCNRIFEIVNGDVVERCKEDFMENG